MIALACTALRVSALPLAVVVLAATSLVSTALPAVPTWAAPDKEVTFVSFPAADEPLFLEGAAKAEFSARIERAMSGLHVVVARFRQEQTFSFFDETVVTEGLLVYERPERLRYELLAPHRSILVVDGDDIGRFVHDGEAWQRRDLDRRADVLLAMMERVRSMFDGRFTADDPFYVARLAAEPAPLVRFDPRGDELRRTLARIELLLEDDLATVHTVRQLHANGDHAATRYTPVARDVQLPAGLFRTERLPEAVDVAALERAEAARRAAADGDDEAPREPDAADADPNTDAPPPATDPDDDAHEPTR